MYHVRFMYLVISENCTIYGFNRYKLIIITDLHILHWALLYIKRMTIAMLIIDYGKYARSIISGGKYVYGCYNTPDHHA